MTSLTIESLFKFYRPNEVDLQISDDLVFSLCNKNYEIHPIIEALSSPYSSIINEMMIEYISKKTKMGKLNPQVNFGNLIGDNRIIFCKYNNQFIGCSFDCPVVSFAFDEKIDEVLPPHFYERTLIHEYTHKATFTANFKNKHNQLLVFISEGIAVAAESEYLVNQYNATTMLNAQQYTRAYNFIKCVQDNYVDIISYNRDIVRGSEEQFISKIKELINNKIPEIDADAYLSLNGLLFFMADYEKPDYCNELYEKVDSFNKKLFDKSSAITQEEIMELKNALAFTKIVNEFVEQMPDEYIGPFTRSLASYLCKSTMANGDQATCLLHLDYPEVTTKFLDIVKNRIYDLHHSRGELGVMTDKTPTIIEELNTLKQKLGIQDQNENGIKVSSLR